MSALEKLLKEQKAFINRELPQTWYTFSVLSLNRLVDDQSRGLRGGRMHQFIGEKSTGKTTLALDIIAQAQKQDLETAFIDFERTFDTEYAQRLGVNTEKLIVVKTDTAEDGLNITEDLVKAGVQVIVIDSIPAAVPSSEYEKDLTDTQKMAVSAGYITRWCRRMTPLLDNSGAVCIVINQWRANFSQMSPKETKAYGPKQLSYTISISLELRRVKNDDDESVVQCYTEKNKQGGKERQKRDIIITYGQGLDVAHDIITLAIEHEIVQKKGAWFYYGDIKAQGMDNAKELFPIEEIRSKL